MKTQQSNPPAAKDGIWLVTPPNGVKFTTALTAACKGNEKLANVLNYFLYEACQDAKRQNINIEQVDYIEIKRLQDSIVAGLERHNKGASKKTIRDKMVILTSLSYLSMDGYHNTYRIYFRNIQAGMHTPPEAEKPKLRGRHVKRLQDGCQDGNFNLKVKSTISAQDGNFNFQEEMVILRQQMLDLTFQMSNLTFEKSNLTSQMSNLTFVVSQQAARIAELEAQLASLYITNTLDNTDSNTVCMGEQSDNSEKGANAPVVTDQHTSSLFPENELPPLETTEPEKPVSPNGSNGKNPDKPNKPAGKEKGKGKGNVTNEPPAAKPKGLDAHTDQEKAFWALWLNADQNKKVPPPYKDSASDHIKALAPQITTQEQMDSLVSFSREKTRKKLNLPTLWKIELGNLRSCFPDWDQAQQKQNKPASTSPATPAPEPSQEILWTEEPDHKGDPVANWFRYHLMPRAEAKEKYKLDYYGELPAGVINEINHKFKLEKLGKITRPDVAIAS